MKEKPLRALAARSSQPPPTLAVPQQSDDPRVRPKRLSGPVMLTRASYRCEVYTGGRHRSSVRELKARGNPIAACGPQQALGGMSHLLAARRSAEGGDEG